MRSITRKIDSQGRLCVPKQFMETIGIFPETDLEVNLEGRAIILTLPSEDTCVICDKPATNYYKYRPLCKDCYEKLIKKEKEKQ